MQGIPRLHGLSSRTIDIAAASLGDAPPMRCWNPPKMKILNQNGEVRQQNGYDKHDKRDGDDTRRRRRRRRRLITATVTKMTTMTPATTTTTNYDMLFCRLRRKITNVCICGCMQCRCSPPPSRGDHMQSPAFPHGYCD